MREILEMTEHKPTREDSTKQCENMGKGGEKRKGKQTYNRGQE
jgi:hypothetical protein